MDIFKVKTFNRWAKSEKLSNKQIKAAVNEMRNGLIDANLGNGIYKKRIAKKGRGRRGGLRTILAFQHEKRAIFLIRFCEK